MQTSRLDGRETTKHQSSQALFALVLRLLTYLETDPNMNKGFQQIIWKPPIQKGYFLPHLLGCFTLNASAVCTNHLKLKLHEVAERCLLPRPAFSVEVVPLDKLVHIV